MQQIATPIPEATNAIIDETKLIFVSQYILFSDYDGIFTCVFNSKFSCTFTFFTVINSISFIPKKLTLVLYSRNHCNQGI